MREAHIADRLSDYLDDELDPGTLAEVDAHLADCDACRAMLSDLEAIAERAGSLEDAPPERDLWPGIAERIEAPSIERASRRRIAFSIPQLAAAALVVVSLTAAAVWWAANRSEIAPVADRTPVEVHAAGLDYTEAVSDLEAILDENRDRLDPETVTALEENLAVIDTAIGEIVTALETDPDSHHLLQSLADARARKLGLLRQASEVVRVSM